MFKQNGSTPPTALDLVSFVCDGYDYQGEPQPTHMRHWHTPDGDGFGLFVFPIPPDLPRNVSSLDEMKAFYEKMLKAQSNDPRAKVVEIAYTTIDQCEALQVILSMPQEHTGRTFIGSITIPFQNFSFVLKVQCVEQGTTGIREAILFDRALSMGKEMKIIGNRFEIDDWNPDDEEYDVQFPHHPLSRARRVLRDVVRSTAVADQLKMYPPFGLPKR